MVLTVIGLFAQLKDQDAETDPYFFDFSENGLVKLREVIVGALSPLSFEQFTEALRDLRPKVACCKARFAFQRFEVAKQRERPLAAD